MIKNFKRISALFFVFQTASMAMEEHNEYHETSSASRKVTFENPDKGQKKTLPDTRKKMGLPLDRIRKAHENAKTNATHGTLEAGQYQLTKPAKNERNRIIHSSTGNKENDETLNCNDQKKHSEKTTPIKGAKKEFKHTKGIP